MAHVSRSDIQRLHPIVRTIFLDDKHALQTHVNMMLRLDVTMIEHSAWLSWGHLESTALSWLYFSMASVKRWVLGKNVRATLARHHRQFTCFRYAVVSMVFMMRVRMIDAMKMNRMREVVRVLQNNLHR